jgi:intraflagellar transport protein 172
MQLRHIKTVISPSDNNGKITAACWSPNNLRLAAVTTNRVVCLFDENGEQKDKFPTKSADPKVCHDIIQLLQLLL